MLYGFLKITLPLAFRVYFRQFAIEGRERIPCDRPVILAGNHPSAFLDATLPASHLPMAVYFLVRGDIYGNRVVRYLLYLLHTLPVFRFRDGFRRMRGNQETFDRCNRILARGRNPVMIMAEGGNSERKRLLPLQKGAAKLAFGAFEANGHENLALVPQGVNYTNVWRFRSDAMVSFGEPLYLIDYLETYRQDQRKAIADLTRDLEEGIRKVVVQIDRAEDEDWANPLLDIAREGEGSEGALEREFARVRRINSMTEAERQVWREAWSRYQGLLEKHGLKSFHPSHLESSRWPGILYVLGTVPFGLSWGLNAPPLLFAHWLTKRLVPSPVFFPSIRFGLGFISWIIYALVTAIAVGWPALALAASGALGYWSLPFFERFSKWRDAMKARVLSGHDLEELVRVREKLVTL